MNHRRFMIGLLVAWLLTGPASVAVAAPLIPNCEQVTYRVQDATGEHSLPQSAYDRLTEDQLKTTKVLSTSISRRCTLEDFGQTFANLAKWGFGLLAVTAVAFFIYGGFLLLISAGRSDYVTRGKSVLTGSFLGSVVVLMAFVIVNLVGTSIGVNRPLLNAGPACRKSVDGTCQGGTLKMTCYDSKAQNGSVTKLQNLLNIKCPTCNLSVDGCFGKKTAECVFAFKIANGMPTSSDETRVTITPAEVSILSDPRSRPCYTLDDVTLTPPINIQPPGGSITPPTRPGCCVPQTGNYACIDVHIPEACPHDISTEPGSSEQNYHFIESACSQVDTCILGGYCILYNIDPALIVCRDVGTASDCGSGESFFAGARIQNPLCI